jgi:hypothetical protein
VLSVACRLVEPDDYAYRASIVAIAQGHFLTFSTAQVDRLAAQLPARWRASHLVLDLLAAETHHRADLQAALAQRG